jgi:ribonuclease M5
MSKQVIVVEGSHDVEIIERIFQNVIVISVNGSAIDTKSMSMIKKLDETHQIILAFDPDHAGERIRRLVEQGLSNVSHVFFPRNKAINRKGNKIGVEHMNKEDIIEAFSKIQINQTATNSDITASFLYDLKLIGHHNSKDKRKVLSEKLNIGDINGKTLLKRLKTFGYMKKDIIEVINEASG